MDVNELGRLSNLTLRTRNQAKEKRFYCCSAFHSHNRVFNNEHNSYPKMSVTCPKPARKVEQYNTVSFSRPEYA